MNGKSVVKEMLKQVVPVTSPNIENRRPPKFLSYRTKLMVGICPRAL